jgi:DNA modification methylase
MCEVYHKVQNLNIRNELNLEVMASYIPIDRNPIQPSLFPVGLAQAPESRKEAASSSTFARNMSLPIHRWFRYSAGFSAGWVENVVRKHLPIGQIRVFDPFAGSGTTLLAAQKAGVESWGTEAHPFVYRIAKAKLAWNSDPEAYKQKIETIRDAAVRLAPSLDGYPDLVLKCYEQTSLKELDCLRQALEFERDNTPAYELAWLTLLTTLRKVSTAGTAQWQYILPNKPKKSPMLVGRAMSESFEMIYGDMVFAHGSSNTQANILQSDARTCDGIELDSINLVITSPPYPNNYDYADATRLEMSFMQEIDGWGDLHEKVRKFLMRSCSQHTPEKNHDLQEMLSVPELDSIREEIQSVCAKLSDIRAEKGGKKTYHLMIAAYFRDIALTWMALRRVCTTPSHVCFVIGDSAPYGIYVPVIQWMERLALAAGFTHCSFEKTRDRNIKWKNRKHRVALQEGRFWARG